MSYPLVLEAPLAKEFLAVVQGFVESSAHSLGLEGKAKMSLALAGEEIFMGLVGLSPKARWEMQDFGSFVELGVQFVGSGPELHKLNLTAGIDAQSDAEVKDLGWLLAARSVDRFQIEHQQKNTRFRIRKNRPFPEGEADNTPTNSGVEHEIREPDIQELLALSSRILAREEERVLPEFLRKPGLLSAMHEFGHLSSLTAFSSSGQILGGGFLERGEGRVAILHGPYLLAESDSLTTRIFHELLNSLAKSKLTGVVTETSLLRLPPSEMESLGERKLELKDGDSLQLQAAYRHLKEEEGFASWGVDWLSNFLNKEYDRLALPRDQYIWRETPSTQKHSVLSCDFRPQLGEVVLRPVLAGQDASKNLREHLQLLSSEGIPNVFFELDLGQSWHLSFAEALKDCNFSPCYLVPSAGRGDLLLLQKGVQN